MILLNIIQNIIKINIQKDKNNYNSMNHINNIIFICFYIKFKTRINIKYIL